MSQISIQCRLVAPAYTRQPLWMLMAEANMPLINELLEQVRQHSGFEVWGRVLHKCGIGSNVIPGPRAVS